ncbi:cytochrome P450 [Dactylosporangium aurantiacum]|uniref:Cytochrome P450 n=1 Tax=Dactylosporangium aurantiacum TaxID=35754 RepID=A0A9Q9IEF6_9ACTN|nr:cytochrome P450 [Dactylosporangium aurantiacum]MDG6105181.1 cytochrome P450 [Dactylosporangium aurantiacum]UWZ51703.1 cytochrome P450 [Dactylosporangium aurantiacum]
MDAPWLDLYGAQFHADPYGELARLREQSWYARTAIGTAVLRHTEVQRLLQLRELRTPGADLLALQGITEGPLVDTMRGFLLNTDGEPHARVRRLVSGAFTTRRIEAFRPVVARIAADLVADLTATSRCDFVAAFAQPFALRVLYTFVGIPVDGSADVQRWTADVGLLFGMDVAAHRDRITAALAGLDAFLDDLLARRRREPRDDLLSALVTDGRLTGAELRAMVVTLMSAGQGTVQHQLGTAMAAFLAHPGQWRLLGDRPDLAARTAEEVVRYCPSALLGVPRIAKSDVTVNDLVLPAGSCVLPVTGAANRDPRVFPAADTFDITRIGAPHLTYGGGIHFCLGAALARVELQESLPRLAAALPAPRADGPADWLPPTEAVYGPTHLPIAYGT